MDARSICLKDAHIVASADTPPSVGNLYVEDDLIVAIEPQGSPLKAADEVLDCSHHVVMPGLANLHVHCRPGRAMNDGAPVPVWHKAVDEIARSMKPEDAYVGGMVAYAEMLLAGVTSSLVMTRHFVHAAEAARDLGARSAVVPLAGNGGNADNGALDRLDESLQTIESTSQRTDDRVQLWPGFDSPLSTSLEGMRSVGACAADNELGLHAHMAETEFEVNKFHERNDFFEAQAFEDAGLLLKRAVIAHCNWLEDGDEERFVRTGASVVHNPSSNMKFASGICEAIHLRDAGVRVVLGTDGMLSNFYLNMFEAMRAALMLQRSHARDAAILTPADVFDMATAQGAGLMKDRVGKLEEGWTADITVLDMSGIHLQPYVRGPINDKDLLNLIVWCGRPSDVEHVICDGKIVVKDRSLTAKRQEDICEASVAVDRRLRPLINHAGN